MNPRLFLPIVGLLPVLAWADDGAAPAKFKITTKRKDDTVEVKAEKDSRMRSLMHSGGSWSRSSRSVTKASPDVSPEFPS